jgi:hypothetical protein
MPKNYNQSRIYKISCNLQTINEIYIGSTADYETRCTNHWSCCNNIDSPEYKKNVYNYIRNNGGFGNFTIDVIEHYPCANKTELRIREQYYINIFKPTLNTNRAYISQEESKEYNKQIMKKHYHNNPAYIDSYNKIIKCSNCDKSYKRCNKTVHMRTKYCQNYKATTTDSSSESIIESETDVDQS